MTVCEKCRAVLFVSNMRRSKRMKHGYTAPCICCRAFPSRFVTMVIPVLQPRVCVDLAKLSQPRSLSMHAAANQCPSEPFAALAAKITRLKQALLCLHTS